MVTVVPVVTPLALTALKCCPFLIVFNFLYSFSDVAYFFVFLLIIHFIVLEAIVIIYIKMV